jgi:hypothetical protein
MDVEAKHIDGHPPIDRREPGMFWWVGNPPIRIHFVCPCGCGQIRGVAVASDPRGRGGNPPVSEWDGNLETPTITTPIQFITGCKWGGLLTAGAFRSPE